jgi:transcription-repair coupling factor (superfamily II helicase)
MHLSGLLNVLRNTHAYRAFLERLGETDGNIGIIRAARPFLLAALAEDWDGPVIYITSQIKRAYNVSEQLPVWLGDRPIFRFAEPTPMFYERAPWTETVIRGRIETLAALIDDSLETPPVIVTSARAVMQRTMPVNQFFQGMMTLKIGQRHPLDPLLRRWVSLGYEPAPLVIEPGTFSRRGGIVDIFPIAADQPIRIEFFDDEIDSLRTFDPATQRSTGKIDHFKITPAREALPEHIGPLAQHLGDWFRTLPPADEDMTTPQADSEPLAAGSTFPYLEHYLPYLYANPVSLLDYAPPETLIVIEDWDDLRDTIADIESNAARTHDEAIVQNQLAPDHPVPFVDWETLEQGFSDRTVLKIEHSGAEDGLRPSPTEMSPQLFSPGGRFGGQIRSFLTHLRDIRKKGEQIIVVSQQAKRLTDLWYEQEGFVPTVTDITDTPGPRSLMFVNGALQEGWSLRFDSNEMHLFTDAEIFGWSRPEPRRRKAVSRTRVPESDYADWKNGDFVVHVDYGVGKFAGMRHRTIESVEREYLMVEYSGTDMLFVPIHQADRLTRYVGADDRPPALNKLGNVIEWTRTKKKVSKAVEEEAHELLELYSQRASAAGHPFSSDSPWQHELEAGFPYVETEDQLRAVREVKADMEKTQPMDRLICGDVGYGKTEVALRAAFKAITDSKQVAVLVPTTVLAQQHFETFSQRLAAFPINVEMLSRFRSKEQQSRLLPKLASGEIDVIIGTHRLLSEDITFKDLGLVIIDEEQRFGVKHKEHFKKLRSQVDVLTMTATPIPRTLYMSMTGVRDISMIQSPPEDRLPVITHVGMFDEHLVRQGILREMERGGQVFYVHNRVRTIEGVRERLQRIVPEARIVVGHGQMSERQLESVMTRFALGEYDVLLSTSIIESGLDIPNANTLIADRADWFGMAQMYQLRGRVGRSAQQAYAYFFHAGTSKLTEESRVRLDALAENTDLGAGFQIAMRDLELRGAGDILSTRQTGHVAAIGLHLYTQLLTQAVQKLKGKAVGEATPVAATSGIVIDLPVPAYLPTDWIPEMALRLQIYRRIANLTDAEDVDLMREELRDRFGPLPAAVEGLLYQIDVKLLAQAANATAIIKPQDRILVKLPYLVEVDRAKLESELGDGVTVTRTAVELDPTDELWRLRLLDVLKRLSEEVKLAEREIG